MILNCDVKSLEIVTAGDLSRDKILAAEIIGKEDLHENNRKAFGLPSRLIAKVLVFRILYGGSAYSFAHDSDFMDVSTSEKYWQKAIDAYYEKYVGIKEWHTTLIQTAKATGRLEIPSGRYFPIAPKQTAWGMKWPDTVIKNYPVQGFGADLVMLARLRAHQLLRESGLEGLLISTIHDSIVADVPDYNVEAIGRLLNQAVEDVPVLCKKTFGYGFTLPMSAEVQYGPNKLDMVELKLDK